MCVLAVSGSPVIRYARAEAVTEIGAPEEEPVIEIIPHEDPVPAQKPLPLPVEEPDEVSS